MSRGPWLICCDLRHHKQADHEPATTAQEIAASKLLRLLRYARRADWKVAHVLDRDRRAKTYPVFGLEPLSTEAVFERQGLSAFSNAAFREMALRCPGARFYIAGFGLNDTILTTLVVGAEYGLEMILVEDAAAVREGAASDESAPAALRSFARKFASSATVAQIEMRSR